MPIDPQKVVLALFGCSLALNMITLFKDSEPECDLAETVEQESLIEIKQVVPGGESAVETLSDEWRFLSATVSHSLARTFSKTNAPHADALGAVYSRLFMWDLDLRRDLHQGDRVELVYRIAEDGLPEISAARLHSKKLSRVISYYKWTAPGDAFPSFWSIEGEEGSYRLKQSPIDDYEQITALLKDRPNHHGMDFKAPVGTPTFSPKRGVVTRVNFGSMKYNGYCVEVKFNDGVLAKFLHLDSVSVKPGQTVSKGHQVGLSGNTGRSTAPHLHYQLDKGKKNIDPIDYHGTHRRTLEGKHLSAYLRDIAPYINRMDSKG